MVIILLTVATVFLCTSLELTKAQEIRISPSTTAEIFGGNVTFDCNIQRWSYKSMYWDFNDQILYSFQDNREIYHQNRTIYSVTHVPSWSGAWFNLTVQGLKYRHGGTYTCCSSKSCAQATLYVLGTPTVHYNKKVFMEEETVLFSCQTNFGGPKQHNVADKLTFSFDNQECKDLPGAIRGTYRYYDNIIKQDYNVFLQSYMNNKKPACHLKSESLCVNSPSTTEINVLYSVKHVRYSPKQLNYTPESSIYCSASGNPEPSIMWENMNNKTTEPGHLLILNRGMVGYNSWKCTATNIIQGVTYSAHVAAVFEVVNENKDSAVPQPAQAQNCNNSEEDEDTCKSWKIVAAVLIFIYVIEKFFVVAYFCKKRWQVTRSART